VKIRRSAALLAGGLALALSAAACGSGGGGGGAGSGGPRGQLTYGEATEKITNFMPLISAGNSTAVANVESRLFLGAYRLYPDFTVRPDLDLLSSEPTAGPVGGKFTVTYKINPKAVWNDGQPITWQDFEFTWQMHRSNDPATGGCPALLSTVGYDQIASVTKGSDDRTVVVTYAKPFGDWKSMFTAPSDPVFSKHVMDQGDPKSNCTYLTKGWPIQSGIPDGAMSGPWVLLKKDIDTQNSVETLTPNPKWWGAPVGLQRLVYQYIGSDAGTTVKNLKSGQDNLVYPQPQLDLVKQVQDLQPNITSQINFGLNFEHMDLNTRNPNLANTAVRKAIALALDRKALVAATVGQFDSRASVLNNRFYVTNQPQYKDTSGGLYDRQDTAQATKLIEGAGYKKGSDGIYASPSGSRLSFDMITTVNNKLREDTVDLVTQQLKAVGIEIKKDLDPDIFGAKTKPKSLEAGGFDIALFAWVSSPFPTPNISIYHSVVGDAQRQNYTHGNDPKVDALLGQLAVETDPAKAADLANQTDAQLWQDLFTIPLYQKPTFIAFSSSYVPYDPATGRGIGDNATQAGPLWNSDTFALKQ
jgi:peptide/nickel transport system substrate-binding protein